MAVSVPFYRSRDWALDLWDHGYQPVIAPLKDKHPVMPWKRWQTERVPRDLVEEWFSHGEHNIALITGARAGIVVVDGDSQEACGHIEAVCEATPMVIQSSKGAHYYYRHPGGKVPNATRILDDPPIDVRGDGGIIMGPGSMHASGVLYRLREGGYDLRSVADLPLYRREWFPDLRHTEICESVRPVVLFSSPSGQDAYSQAQKYVSATPGATQGAGGDSFTYVMACRLVRGFNLPDEEAISLLREWNRECTPPWDEQDLKAKVQHARAYGAGEFGSMLVSRGNLRQGLLCYGWPQ